MLCHLISDIVFPFFHVFLYFTCFLPDSISCHDYQFHGFRGRWLLRESNFSWCRSYGRYLLNYLPWGDLCDLEPQLIYPVFNFIQVLGPFGVLQGTVCPRDSSDLPIISLHGVQSLEHRLVGLQSQPTFVPTHYSGFIAEYLFIFLNRFIQFPLSSINVFSSFLSLLSLLVPFLCWLSRRQHFVRVLLVQTLLLFSFSQMLDVAVGCCTRSQPRGFEEVISDDLFSINASSTRNVMFSLLPSIFSLAVTCFLSFVVWFGITLFTIIPMTVDSISYLIESDITDISVLVSTRNWLPFPLCLS